ncbi:hypothetical protein EX30DRAFT_374093 [Ascodesmis nigricans]|uniref:Uncharacterized protein n=1 Tax=Ascodesmis nigricans TaxID=341454 RepID=A0A4S2MM85_9PEZI|nr:hypothetical protein EX30DRAFT_374093 [Ascodesmis nigricans]
MLGAPISNDMYEPALPMNSRRGSRRASGRRSQRLSFPWRKQERGARFSCSDPSVESVQDDNESDTSEYTDTSDDMIESGSDNFQCSLAPRPEPSISQLNPICEKTKFEPSHFTTYKLTRYKSNSTDDSKTESDCEEVSEFGPEEEAYPNSETPMSSMASLFTPPPLVSLYSRSQSTIGLQRRTSTRRIDQARYRRRSSGQSDGPRAASSFQSLRQPLTVNTDFPPSLKSNQESQKTIDHSWSYLDLIPSPDESEPAEGRSEYPAISISRSGEPSILNTLTSPSDAGTSLFSPTDSVNESSTITSFHCVGLAPGSIHRPSTATFRRRSSLFQTVINNNNRHSIQSTTTIKSEVSSSPPPILRNPSQRSTPNCQRLGQRSRIAGVSSRGLRSHSTFPPRTSSYSYIPSTGNNTRFTSPLTTSSTFTNLHCNTIEEPALTAVDTTTRLPKQRPLPKENIGQNQWRHPDYQAEQWLTLHDQPEIAAMYHSTTTKMSTNYGSRSSPSLHSNINTNTPILDPPRPRQPPPCAGLPTNPRPQKSQQQNPKPYPTHPAYRPQIHKPLSPHPLPLHNQSRWRLSPVSIPPTPPLISAPSSSLLSHQQEQASPRSTHHHHHYHYHIFGPCRSMAESTGEEGADKANTIHHIMIIVVVLKASSLSARGLPVYVVL